MGSIPRSWYDYFAYGYFIMNTFTIIVLLDMMIFGKPYVTSFLLIFALIVYLNIRILNKTG